MFPAKLYILPVNWKEMPGLLGHFPSINRALGSICEGLKNWQWITRNSWLCLPVFCAWRTRFSTAARLFLLVVFMTRTNLGDLDKMVGICWTDTWQARGSCFESLLVDNRHVPQSAVSGEDYMRWILWPYSQAVSQFRALAVVKAEKTLGRVSLREWSRCNFALIKLL